MKVVGVARDGGEAVPMAHALRPAIVLMDVRMPGMDGVKATQIIHRNHPEMRILMLTTFDDDEYVFHAMRYGAVGYLLKNMPPAELFASIRAAKEGSVLVAPAVAEKLLRANEKGGGCPPVPNGCPM